MYVGVEQPYVGVEQYEEGPREPPTTRNCEIGLMGRLLLLIKSQLGSCSLGNVGSTMLERWLWLWWEVERLEGMYSGEEGRLELAREDEVEEATELRLAGDLSMLAFFWNLRRSVEYRFLSESVVRLGVWMVEMVFQFVA